MMDACAGSTTQAPAQHTPVVCARFAALRLVGRAAPCIRNLADETVVYELNQVGYRFGRPRTFGMELNYRI